jgi:hypothetical protein
LRAIEVAVAKGFFLVKGYGERVYAGHPGVDRGVSAGQRDCAGGRYFVRFAFRAFGPLRAFVFQTLACS